MKDLKDTLDALSKHWRQWAKKLWLAYIALALAVAALLTVLLKYCLDVCFPLWEYWRATDSWEIATAMVPVDKLWIGILCVAVAAAAAAMWWAHKTMSRTVGTYTSKRLTGQAFLLPALLCATLMLVTLCVVWLPVVLLFLSADAAAQSILIDDPVVTPLWVWIACFSSAFIATFICEIAMTLCRLAFRKIEVPDPS